MNRVLEKIIVVVQYYIVVNADTDYSIRRQREINECLLRNVQNSSVDEVHVLTECDYDYGFIPSELHYKLHVTNIGKRLTYDFVFNYYNTKLANHICILVNADIYTNNSVDILRHVRFTNVLFAMNRYEDNDRNDLLLLNGLEVNLAARHKCPYLIPFQPSVWSQDAWIWKSPNIIIRDCDFELGTPGCDNYIIYQLIKQHYIVSNPSRLLCINHIDRLSIHHESYGIVKGNVSKKREQRVGDMNTYIFLENQDDIPDKYTTHMETLESSTNPKYKFIKTIKLHKNIIEIQPSMCTVSASSTHDCEANDIFLKHHSHWEPLQSDKNPYIEFSFHDLQTIVIIDIVGKLVLRNDATVGYISSLCMEWINEDLHLESAIHKGITIPNGNYIHRIYLDAPMKTTNLRVFLKEYVGVRSLKMRMFVRP